MKRRYDKTNSPEQIKRQGTLRMKDNEPETAGATVHIHTQHLVTERNEL